MKRLSLNYSFFASSILHNGEGMLMTINLVMPLGRGEWRVRSITSWQISFTLKAQQREKFPKPLGSEVVWLIPETWGKLEYAWLMWMPPASIRNFNRLKQNLLNEYLGCIVNKDNKKFIRMETLILFTTFRLSMTCGTRSNCAFKMACPSFLVLWSAREIRTPKGETTERYMQYTNSKLSARRKLTSRPWVH